MSSTRTPASGNLFVAALEVAAAPADDDEEISLCNEYDGDIRGILSER